MKNFILKFLIRLFFDKQREIKKITLGEEFSKYLFRSQEDVLEILKHNRTCMTLWHWETNGKDESLLIKGMGLMLNILIDAHEMAVNINMEKDDNKKLYLWKKYKEVKERNDIWLKIKNSYSRK